MTSDVETRHVVGVSEDESTMTITLEKAPPPPMLQPTPDNEGPHYPPKNAYEDGDRSSKEIIRREIEFEATEVNKDERTIELAFSSEFPVERGYGMEVLDHAPTSVKLERLNNSAPLLVNHNADDQVGVVESARIDGDKTGRAWVRFGTSQRAQEIFEDVVSGIRKGISVGYYILKSKLEQRDGVETVLATLWEPLEISVASIAADWKGSGVGRSIESTTQRKELNTMSENTEIKNEEPKIDIGAEVEKRTAESVKRSKDILMLGAQYDCIEDASAFVNDGKTSGEFSRWILENKRKVEPVQQSVVLEDKKDRENFSISRAVRNFIDNGKWTGYEAEVSQTAQKAQGRATAGLCIPTSAFAKRDVTAATSGSGLGYGGNTVSTDLSGFIDLLRNEAVALQAGATVMDGLVGNIAIPRLAGGATAYWLAEQGAVTEAVPTFDQVTLSPKRLAMHVNISKQLIAQSSVDVENIIRNDLVATAANAIDTAVFTGAKYPTAGASDQPTGLYETIRTDLAANDVDFGAAPTYAEIVSLERLVADQNALRGNLAYVTSPLGAYTAKTVVLDSGSGRFLFEDGKMNSYPCFISKNVSVTMDDPTQSGTQTADTAYYFGNWSDCLVGNWGGLDVVIDPYTLATTGTIRMIVTMFTDIDFRHVGSFAVGYLGSA